VGRRQRLLWRSYTRSTGSSGSSCGRRTGTPAECADLDSEPFLWRGYLSRAPRRWRCHAQVESICTATRDDRCGFGRSASSFSGESSAPNRTRDMGRGLIGGAASRNIISCLKLRIVIVDAVGVLAGHRACGGGEQVVRYIACWKSGTWSSKPYHVLGGRSLITVRLTARCLLFVGRALTRSRNRGGRFVMATSGRFLAGQV
jgi:hypothetical protein